MNILHLDSSPLGGHSVTRELTAATVEALRAASPAARVVRRDLAADPLPHWAPVADTADAAVRNAGQVLDEFLAADTVVIGAPMYNFTIPSQLKAWIDQVLVAGKTFRYTANGPEGLAGGKRVIVVLARGGFYGAGSAGAAADFQEPYLRQVFAFIGITDVEFVRAEGIAMGPEQRAAAVAAAREAIGPLRVAA